MISDHIMSFEPSASGSIIKLAYKLHQILATVIVGLRSQMHHDDSLRLPETDSCS